MRLHLHKLGANIRAPAAGPTPRRVAQQLVAEVAHGREMEVGVAGAAVVVTAEAVGMAAVVVIARFVMHATGRMGLRTAG